MAERQRILDLDIDVEGVIRKSSDLKKELDDLKKTQAEMKKSGDTSSEAYVKLEAQIKKITSEYSNNQKQLVNLTNAGGGMLTVQEKLNMLLNEEVDSITRAKQSNAELKKIRDELKLSAEANADAIEELNKKIDENDELIKDNVSSREKDIMSIGSYKDAIKEAFQETGLFTNELSALTQVSEKFSGVFDYLKDGVKDGASRMRNAAAETDGMSMSQKALTIATNLGTGAMRIFALAIAATGIGLIIVAVALLISYFKTFTPVVDFVEQALAGLGAVVKVVQKGVVSFVTGLSDLGNTLKKVGSFLSNPIKGFKDMAGAMEEAYDAAAKLKKEQQDLEDAISMQELASAKARAEINRLNIQAKDRTKSDEERLAMLEKAAQIEEKDFQQRRANSDEALRIAQQQIINEAELTKAEANELKKRGLDYKEFVEQRTNGVDDLFDALKDALLAQTDIENEFYSNQEKNINKRNKLIEDQEEAAKKAREKAIADAKKAEEARQKALDNAVNESKARLDLFISEQGYKAKSLQEELKIAEEVRDKRLRIAQLEFNASKKTESDRLKLLTDQNNIKNEFLQKQSEATIANAQRELDAELKSSKSKIDSAKFLTEFILNEEQRRLDLIAEKNAQFQALRLEQGIINEQQYQDAITAIQDEVRLKKEEAQKERDVAEAERKAIDLENTLLIEEALFQNSLETQLKRLELQRQQEIKESDKTGASLKLINEKYALAEKALRQNVEQSKLQMTADGLSQAKGFFKESSLAYKAFAIAEATINTYKAASLALSTYAYPVGGIFAGLAIAQGLLNVSKIAGIKLAKGGRVKGPGTGTSDSIPAQLSNGETVINAKSSEMFAPLLSAMNVAGGGVAFAKGSVSYPAISASKPAVTNSSVNIDYDLLASKISEANLNLPAPIVFAAVEDINNGQKNYANIVNGANL